MPRNRDDFIFSKCDRCGRVTSHSRDGVGLFVLEHDLPHGLADQGSFCMRCITRYSTEEWYQWFREHRPEYMQKENNK